MPAKWFFVLALGACSQKAPAPAASGQTVGSLAPLPSGPTASVWVDKEGGQINVRVEVADSPAEREQGLMYRRELEADAGMLFLFPREAQQTFWMKNTFLPLDMIFIRADLSIAGIVENAEPMTLTRRSVPEVSQYVLEVNGGFAAQHGVKQGGHVVFDGVPQVPVQ